MATTDSTLADTDEKIFIGKGEQPAWLTLALANRHGHRRCLGRVDRVGCLRGFNRVGLVDRVGCVRGFNRMGLIDRLGGFWGFNCLGRRRGFKVWKTPFWKRRRAMWAARNEAARRIAEEE